MRKPVITLLVFLGLGGAAAAAVIAGNAHAEAPKMPALVTMVTPAALASDNIGTPPDGGIQIAQASGGAPPAPAGRERGGRAAPRTAPTAAERAARQGEMCQDRYARVAGQLAYLETRLALNATQSPAFARWRDVQLATAKRQASECAARPVPQFGRGGRGQAGTPPSPVERMAREETMLQQRLTDLQAEHPALEALYNSLTPAQRQNFLRGNGPRGMMMGGMRGRMMFGHGGPGMRGRAMRGPMRGPGTPPPTPSQ